MYDIKIREFNPTPAMTVRFTTNLRNISSDMGKIFQELWDYISSNKGECAGECFAVYHDENFNPERIDAECGFSVKKLLPESGRIKGRIIEGGSMVSVIHTGPYTTVEKAYNAIIEWMGANGYTPAAPMMELYLNDPSEVPESELKTEILWPYKK